MKFTRLLSFLLTVTVLSCATSCIKDDGYEYNPDDSKAYLLYDVVIWQATGKGGEQTRIITEGDMHASFTATITEGDDFCSFERGASVSQKSGAVGQMGVFLYLDNNTAETSRQVAIHIVYDDGTLDEMLYLTQHGFAASASYDKHEWPEMPEYVENNDYIYKTYYTTLTTSRAKVRNFSICYDSKRHISQWVAYPMHTCYTTPPLSRVDTFDYDPNDQPPYISQSIQQYITNAAYGTGHSRGHMLPNASRYNNYETNRMTFYATNMMPQHGGFNGGVWSKLESLVRENQGTKERDTLYVVVGTYFGDGYTINDRKGLEIAVPSHAYKVLLKAKKAIPAGKTIADLEADELQAIGFWFTNPKLNEKSTEQLAEGACTVAEIEERTGFSYFQMLKPEVAKAVKQQKKPGDWGL